MWEYAVHTAVHVYNRTPSCGLQWRTPHETWDVGHVPDVSYFRVFGCKAYAHVPKDERKKLDPKSTETTFIGYDPGSKGYRLWDKRTRSVKLSRDVTFDESSFPSRADVEGIHPPTASIIMNVPTFMPVYATLATAPPVRAASPHSDDSDADDVEDLLDPKVEPQSVRPATPPPIAQPPPSTPSPKSEPPNSPPPRQSAQRTEVLPPTPELRVPGGMENALRKGTRTRVPNPRYFNAENAEIEKNRRLGHAELLAAAFVGRDPATFAEAMRSENSEEWMNACQYEIDALHKNNTWELKDLPAGRKAVKSKWVFKLKADGRFRARLVAKGFTQIPGIDYDETFSPVALFESLRLLLALAPLENWEIHQMDVKSAFLNGVLNEEIYME